MPAATNNHNIISLSRHSIPPRQTPPLMTTKSLPDNTENRISHSKTSNMKIYFYS